MKRKLSKKELKKMIASDFTDLSTEEIKALIQKEVDKGADKLDTDYIDLCFELLSIKENQKSSKRIKFKSPAKAFIAAAVLIVVFISSITVFAINWNIPQKIAELVNGNAKIDYNLENADTTADGYTLSDTDLAKELAEYGISPVTLPEEIIKENCKITEIESMSSDDISNIVSIDFVYNSQQGYLIIEQMSEDLETAGVWTVNDIESGQTIKVNGMDVLVFKQKNNCSIVYKDNLTKYEIYLECDLETAIQFAESIK